MDLKAGLLGTLREAWAGVAGATTMGWRLLLSAITLEAGDCVVTATPVGVGPIEKGDQLGGGA